MNSREIDRWTIRTLSVPDDESDPAPTTTTSSASSTSFSIDHSFQFSEIKRLEPSEDESVDIDICSSSSSVSSPSSPSVTASTTAISTVAGSHNTFVSNNNSSNQLKAGYPCTLQSCLQFDSEGSNRWRTQHPCPTCNSIPSPSSIHISFPEIAVFHFNRYRWTGKVIQRATRSGAKGKINTKVNFPLRLSLGTFLHSAKTDTPTKYILKSVIVHEGLTPVSGHYFAYCLNDNDQCWYRFDDQQHPTPTDENKVMKANPFMLFYQREDI